jgi:hypothetical protein
MAARTLDRSATKSPRFTYNLQKFHQLGANFLSGAGRVLVNPLDFDCSTVEPNHKAQGIA